MDANSNDLEDLRRSLRRVGILSPPFTRSGGILQTTAIGLSSKERTMKSESSPDYEEELPVPDGAEHRGSTEFLRAWIVNGQLDVSMRAGVVEHPLQWGGILADFARYVMAIFADESDRAQCQKVLDDVVRGFEQRLFNPERSNIDTDNQESTG